MINLLGQLVQQGDRDCFAAALSMLSGIDYDLIRDKGMWPQYEGSEKPLDGFFHEPSPEFTITLTGPEIEAWRALLTDNGFEWVESIERPSEPYLAFLAHAAGGHAAIGLGDGTYIDPNRPFDGPVTDFPYAGPLKECICVVLREAPKTPTVSLRRRVLRNVLRRKPLDREAAAR